jgi:hypothetical protein
MVDAWIRSTVGAQLSVSARSSIAARDAGVIQQAAMLTAHVVFLYHGTGGATESYVTQKSKIKKTKELKKGIQIAAARPDATTGQNTMPTTKQNQLVMKHFQKACKWYIHDASAPWTGARGLLLVWGCWSLLLLAGCAWCALATACGCTRVFGSEISTSERAAASVSDLHADFCWDFSWKLVSASQTAASQQAADINIWSWYSDWTFVVTPWTLLDSEPGFVISAKFWF